MGVVIASGTALSTAANVKSADQVTGTYQFLPFDATLLVAARGSATGNNILMFADGQAVMNDLAIPYTGTAGAISVIDHEIASIDLPAGSRIEFFVRNTTGGTLTTDFIIDATPLD